MCALWVCGPIDNALQVLSYDFHLLTMTLDVERISRHLKNETVLKESALMSSEEGSKDKCRNLIQLLTSSSQK